MAEPGPSEELATYTPSEQVELDAYGIEKADNVEVQENGPFIHFNFRGLARWISKDNLTHIPYLYNLAFGPCQNSPRDAKGRYLVDENYNIISFLIDKHRSWLEKLAMKPGKATLSCSSSLVISIARAMGCDSEFIVAISQKPRSKGPTEDDCFKCCYCDNIHLKGKDSVSRCRYHAIGCQCDNGRMVQKYCAEVPFHTEFPLTIAAKRLVYE